MSHPQKPWRPEDNRMTSQSAERKRLSTKNSIYSKTTFENKGEMKSFPNE